MAWIYWLAALAAGMANPFQSGTNAELHKHLGQVVWTGMIVYATGLCACLLLHLAFPSALPAAARLREIPWWAWLGGLISVGPTVAGLSLAQKMGAGVFTGLSITAAMVCAVLLDQFGWIGFKQHTASPARWLGCALMIAGLWLVSRF